MQKNQITLQNNETITQSSVSSFNFSVFSDKIQDIPKKQLNPIIFVAAVIMMLFCCYSNLFYVYAPLSIVEKKGQLCAVSLGYCVLISFATFYSLISFKQLIRLAILVDTIMLVNVSAAIAFINLILIFDKNHEWYFGIMEAGFAIEMTVYATVVRVLLVHMKWSKWRLIFFKLHAIANTVMFLVMGVYFIWVDFSYTKHYLLAFDGKVKDFMLLYIFSLMAFTYEIHRKITDLDHTGDLKYIYEMRNFDKQYTKKRQSIIHRKRQSINCIQLLKRQSKLNQYQQIPKASRFANILNVENLS